MRKKETFDLDNCDFPTCRELTEEELLLVNGGKKIENSNAAVAEAQVGDSLTRNDGTTVTISTTADICLGITGTYDLDNMNSSGLPNSWGFGSVGGGVWKNGSIVIPVHKGKKL